MAHILEQIAVPIFPKHFDTSARKNYYMRQNWLLTSAVRKFFLCIISLWNQLYNTLMPFWQMDTWSPVRMNKTVSRSSQSKSSKRTTIGKLTKVGSGQNVFFSSPVLRTDKNQTSGRSDLAESDVTLKRTLERAAELVALSPARHTHIYRISHTVTVN